MFKEISCIKSTNYRGIKFRVIVHLILKNNHCLMNSLDLKI